MKRPEYLLGLVALAAVYYGAAELGTSLAFADNATALWPPAGLAAAVIAVFGWRWLPGIALGEVVALVVMGTPAEHAIPQFAGNLAEATVAAWILRRAAGGAPRFRRLGAIGVLAVAAIPAAAFSATAGGLSLLAADSIPSNEFWTVWFRWLTADVASILLIVPLVAVLADARASDDVPRRHPLEVAGAAVAVAASATGALVLNDLPLSFAVFPALVWCALRMGRPGAVLGSFLAAAITVAAAAADAGPFGIPTDDSEALLLAQAFVVVASLTTLALAIVNRQRVRAARERERSLAQLQAILNAAPAAIYVKDLAGRYRLASKYLERVWGSKDGVIGKTDADLMPASAAAEVRASDKRLIETGEIVDAERVVPEPRGDRIYQGSRFPIVDAAGEITGVGGIALDVTEQREAELRLAKSEEMLARTAELGRVGGWDYHVATERFSWSDLMYELHGVDPETFEVSVEAWSQLTHADDRERALSIFGAALSDEPPDEWEMRRRSVHPSGEERVLLSRGQVHRDEHGQAEWVVGFDQDITELAAAEEETRRSEELLERVAELGRIGGWEYRVADDTFTWSSEMYRIHGVDPETFVPTRESWGGLIHPDDAARSVAAMNALREQRQSVTWEHQRRIVRPDGATRVLLGRGQIHVDDQGEPILVTGFDQDITELAAAEEKRRQTEELMERIAELGQVGGWSLDPRTREFTWSAQLYKIHGVDPDTFEVTSESWTALLHPDDVEVARIIEASIGDPERTGWHQRRRIVRPDGEVRVLEGRGLIDRDSDGNPIRITGYDQDITELAALTEEQRRSEELLARTAELGRVGGWECDVPATYFKWSAEQYRIHGVDPETFVPTEAGWHALIHPDDLQYSTDIVVGAILDPSSDGWEYSRRIVRPDGQVRIVLGRGHIHRDEDGTPRHLTGLDQDITELAAAEEELRRSEKMLTRTAELGRVGGWVMDLATGRITWSAEQYKLYGLDPETFVPTPKRWEHLVHPDDRERVRAGATAAAESGERWDFMMRIFHADGSVRHLRSNGEMECDADGNPVRVHGFEQDVTDHVRAREELERAEHRYRSLVERLPAVSYVAKAGPAGEWTYVSPQIERMLGYTPEEWIADPTLWATCIHPDDRDRVIEIERKGIATGAPLAMEYRMQARDGRTLWIRDEALVRPDRDGLYFDGMLTDITERKAFETQLQFLADHDPLTGLFNRRRFVEELSMESKLVLREGHCATVVMLDLDNFKYINDSLGHRAGDVLIRGIADTLERRLRETDTLARLGGDEFAALLRGTSPAEAHDVVTELLDAIRDRTHALSDEPVRVTASAGMVALDDAAASAEELLAAADLAMYSAKQTGRDRVAVFSPELQHEIRTGRSWADRIRTSLDADGFELFCQPIVDLATDAVSQWEVLLRMRTDEGQIISPDAFLPLAERFDLIQQVDRWVALETIALMERRLEAGQRVRLEVNLSAKSLVDPAFMAALETALRQSTIDPSDLIFEVTETAAIANMDEARAFSERLRRLGCGFALDDFGSGFASFYYLKHLPVDYVKIDGDFVRSLTASPVDQQVVKAMIAIAKALGQKTVAEFVGDQPTVELLRSLGVDYVQGYYLGVPVPVARLGERTGAVETQPSQS